MKIVQKALLLSVLSLGLSKEVFSCPPFLSEGPKAKDESLVMEPESVSKASMKRDIRFLEWKNNDLEKENDRLEQQNKLLQSQVRDLTQVNTLKANSDSSTISGTDLKDLQVTMKEILAEQKNANALSERQLALSLKR